MTNRNTRQQLANTRNRREPLNFVPFAAAISALTSQQIALANALLEHGTVLDIQTAFRDGQLTSEAFVACCVRRIQQYDARLNSVVELNPDALIAASAADKERRQLTVIPPLHGIPILLKDNIDTGDKMQTTAGAAALMGTYAADDAFLVTRLRENGAIILGKNNLSEWAFWMSSDGASGYSFRGGQTRNPYGKFDVGGSSSGSGVSVAAGFAPLSIGTETCGSLTSPAAKNGLVTLKPGCGLVSRSGIVPIVDTMDTAGPMAKNVTDVAILLTAISGGDPADPDSNDAAPLFGADFAASLSINGLRGVRVGLWQFAEEGVSRWFTRAYNCRAQQFIPMLENAGAQVVMLPPQPAESPFPVGKVLTAGFRASVNRYLANRPHLPEYARSLESIIAYNQTNEAELAPFNQNLLIASQNSEYTAESYREFGLAVRADSRQWMDELFTAHNIKMIVSLNNHFAAHYAPAGCPALSVPAAFKRNGEPFNITFSGRYLDEPILLAAAYAFEQANSGRRAPVLS